MPKKYGNGDKLIKVCDRCHFKLTRDWGIKDYLPIDTDGWKTIEKIYICDKCYRHFLHIFEKFINKEL